MCWVCQWCCRPCCFLQTLETLRMALTNVFKFELHSLFWVWLNWKSFSLRGRLFWINTNIIQKLHLVFIQVVINLKHLAVTKKPGAYLIKNSTEVFTEFLAGFSFPSREAAESRSPGEPHLSCPAMSGSSRHSPSHYVRTKSAPSALQL